MGNDSYYHYLKIIELGTFHSLSFICLYSKYIRETKEFLRSCSETDSRVLSGEGSSEQPRLPSWVAQRWINSLLSEQITNLLQVRWEART